jgi:heme-degrading monooxygenase HmoA
MSAAAEPDQIVTVFRSRLKATAGQLYEDTAQVMLAEAQRMPGFVDFKTFTADDGERVSLITFTDQPSHDAWRDDPDHEHVQRVGRRRFYAEYQIQVCRCLAVRRFEAD